MLNEVMQRQQQIMQHQNHQLTKQTEVTHQMLAGKTRIEYLLGVLTSFLTILVPFHLSWSFLHYAEPLKASNSVHHTTAHLR